MTPRELCMNLLHYREADRLPAVHFGYWGQLIKEWASQGHISAELAEAYNNRDAQARDELNYKILGWDCSWGDKVAGTRNGLLPAFERKTLEVLADGSHRVLTAAGVIERVKPGVVSIPSEDDYLLKDREAFETLYRPKMQFSPERVNYEYFKSFNAKRDMNVPIGIGIGSVMGKIRDYTTVVGMSYLMYDEDEELFADIVDTYAEMQYKCAEEALSTGAQFDYAHFWEDICFKNGPLLSPKKFDELCGKHYKKRCELCHAHGIDVISLDCDGVVEELIPTWIENGVNVLFPIEVGVWGDQFESARKKYGERLLGVGGMDKIAFRKDKAAVDKEIERMKRLASMGGFVPCPDHRLMPGSKFELVQYYAEEIKKIKI